MRICKGVTAHTISTPRGLSARSSDLASAMDPVDKPRDAIARVGAESLCKGLTWIVGLCPTLVFAGGQATHADPVTPVILWVTLIFFFGLMGRYLAKRLNQPGVLGELLMGVLLGNVCYFFGMQLAVILREGPVIYSIMQELLTGHSLKESIALCITDKHYAAQVMAALAGHEGFDWIKIAYVADIFSRYGVIFLLFMVGLESSVQELKRTGRESAQVAVIGVLAPIAFGLVAVYFLMPFASFKVNLFVAATLCATSAGITARVFKDINILRTREARTILGAAMIDDILGLVILAVVSQIVLSGQIDGVQIIKIIMLTALFFTVALSLGPKLLKKAVLLFQFMDPWEAKLAVSFIFLMCLSWLATLAQLATIIGAFVAGIIIHDGMFKRGEQQHPDALSIQNVMAPLESLLAPLFFMLVGIQVKLELFFDWHVLLLASGLIIAAILGKLVSGLGGSKKDDRLLIGIGMLPRGEVGLVFASIGRTLGVITDDVFSAIILMVIVTTLISPLWLKERYRRRNGEKRAPTNT